MKILPKITAIGRKEAHKERERTDEPEESRCGKTQGQWYPAREHMGKIPSGVFLREKEGLLELIVFEQINILSACLVDMRVPNLVSYAWMSQIL